MNIRFSNDISILTPHFNTGIVIATDVLSCNANNNLFNFNLSLIFRHFLCSFYGLNCMNYVGNHAALYASRWSRT